jgi:hypothetical protein
MTFQRKPGLLYQMPAHFGPSLGPRQTPDGGRYGIDKRSRTGVSVHFLTRAEQLEPYLPEGFSLVGEPVVTISGGYMKNIEWLAGRGYNVLGVRWPVTYKGQEETVTGTFLSVLWENMTEPILTGREELGFSKIYCELPDPRFFDNRAVVTASWDGFTFLELELTNLEQVTPGTPEPGDQGLPHDGLLHYRYHPRTGEWGEPDIEQVTISPAGSAQDSEDTEEKVVEVWHGDGTVTFNKARWEDMPTQYHIVNALAGLDILEYRGASIVKSSGSGDLSEQRIVR